MNVVSQACSVIGTEGRIRDPQAGLVIAHRRGPPKDRSTIAAGMAVFNQAVPGDPCLSVRKALPRQLDLFARKLRKAGHLRVCCLTVSLRYRSTSRKIALRAAENAIYGGGDLALWRLGGEGAKLCDEGV